MPMDVGTTTATSGFSQDFFMKLLVTELQNQDPDNPVSNADMTSQISSMAMVQGMNNLNTSFSQVLKLQQLLSSADLIGRQVQFQNSDGTFGQGLVQSVDTSGDTISLTVNGQNVSPTNVTKIL
jgi:flagellar basal-body rod modification protein FlgD